MQKYNYRKATLKTDNLFLLNNMVANKEENEIQYCRLVHPIEVNPPKIVSCFNIILFERAKGYIQIDEYRYALEDKMAIVVFPGQIVSCLLEEPTIGHYLAATRERYETMTSIGNMPLGKSKPISAFKLTKANFDVLSQEFMEIKKLMNKQQRLVSEILINRFKTIYLILKSKCIDSRLQHIEDIRNPLAKKFIQLLEETYRDNKSVKYYATAIHVSPNYLNRLAKEHFGVPAKQFVKDRILTEAKRLLMGTDQSIKLIAHHLGFKSIANFSNFFKKESGFYPTDFIHLRSKNVEQNVSNTLRR